MTDDTAEEDSMAEVVPLNSPVRTSIGNPKYHAVIQRITALHDRKAHDYAQSANPYSNFEYAATVSERFLDPVDRVFATMVGIKLARIAELRGAGKTPQNESLRDSFDDLTNYAAIWASYQEP